MAKGIHTELTFESAIEASLLEFGRFIKGFSVNFVAKLVVILNECLLHRKTDFSQCLILICLIQRK
jgi:hypothetical protein